MARDGFLKEVADAMTAQDAAVSDEPAKEAPPITSKMVEIIVRLQANLLLVEPTLQWVKAKEAEMAQAQLGVLYSPGELAAMQEKAGLPAEASTDVGSDDEPSGQ